MPGDALALELRGITKRFGSLVANNAIDFELKRGEIHALLGENGAGKSTLMNVLYGLHQPDEGEILLDGEPVRVDSPRRAIGLGIGMVHQHFMLVPVMTVAENLVLGSEPHRGPLLDYKAAAARTRELSDALRARDRPRGARRGPRGRRTAARGDPPRAVPRREGARARRADGRADRPGVAGPVQGAARAGRRRARRSSSSRTSSTRCSTSPTASRCCAAARRSTRSRPKGVDRAQPRAPDGRPRRAAARREARAHAGRAAARGRGRQRHRRPRAAGGPRTSRFNVRAGEIVGLAGVDANGQSELIEAITGLRTDGRRVGEGRRPRRHRARHARDARHGRRPHRRGPPPPRPRARVHAGREPDPARVPRARLHEDGLAVAAQDDRAAPRGCCATTTCAAATPNTRAASLSGGNQQKCVIARELSANPKVLIAAQPTRGLDVGAIEFVHRRLVEERDAGRAILLVSLELEEIRSLSRPRARHLRGRRSSPSCRPRPPRRSSGSS